MSFVPQFRLYQSDGTTLIYTFPIVYYTNIPGQTPTHSIIIEGQRGKGSVVIEGGEESADIIVEGVFMIGTDEGYEELTAKIVALEDAIDFDTPYILRMDKTASTYWEYRVKKVEATEYPESLRTDSQKYIVRLKSKTW